MATTLVFVGIIILPRTYVCGNNLLQHTRFGGDRYLSQQTKYLSREAIATIQTFHGERTVSTKLKLVAPTSYLNRLPICGGKLLQQYIHSVAEGLFQQT
jgi:hypothetical protein